MVGEGTPQRSGTAGVDNKRYLCDTDFRNG